MRRWCWILLLALGGCAGLGGPRSLTITPQEMSARLAREFPVDRRLLEVFDVRVSDPRMRTEPDSSRVRADFRVQATERLTGSRFDANLGVLAGLRWQASDGTLRLDRVDLDLPEALGRDQPWLRRMGALLGARVFEDRVIWRAPADTGLTVERIAVTPGAVVLSVAPAR